MATPSVVTSQHFHVYFKRNGSLETTHILVTSNVYENLFKLMFRNRPKPPFLSICDLNVGNFQDCVSTRIDIEKYTVEERSLYIAGLFEICLANGYQGQNQENEILQFLYKSHSVSLYHEISGYH